MAEADLIVVLFALDGDSSNDQNYDMSILLDDVTPSTMNHCDCDPSLKIHWDWPQNLIICVRSTEKPAITKWLCGTAAEQCIARAHACVGLAETVVPPVGWCRRFGRSSRITILWSSRIRCSSFLMVQSLQLICQWSEHCYKIDLPDDPNNDEFHQPFMMIKIVTSGGLLHRVWAIWAESWL